MSRRSISSLINAHAARGGDLTALRRQCFSAGMTAFFDYAFFLFMFCDIMTCNAILVESGGSRNDTNRVGQKTAFIRVIGSSELQEAIE